MFYMSFSTDIVSHYCIHTTFPILVDRYFAHMPNRKIRSNDVLLVSIATLHIAIKVRESTIIKSSTLAWFGRNKFSSSTITNIELKILLSLDWGCNPPTTIAFIMHFLLLLPDNMNRSKREIYETSSFMAGT